MHRRSSYAAVAAGNSNASPAPATPRPDSSSFPHTTAPSSGPYGASPPGVYSRAYSRSPDTEGLSGMLSLNPTWGRLSAHPLPSQQAGAGTQRPAPTGPSPSLFFVPSYLRGSQYAVAAARRHAEWKAAQDEVAAAVLKATTTAIHVGQLSGVPRGIVHDVVERPASLAEDAHVQPWPAQWSAHAKHANLEITGMGRIVGQALPPRNGNHEEGVAVRAVAPAPPQAGLYYYEIEVIAGGVVAVGFATNKSALTRLPGWEHESWAYHTDDGRLYDGNSQGKPYGPIGQPGDIIGCGINFGTGAAFFTKNGTRLDTISPNLKPEKAYYPVVGTKKAGDMIKANFGQDKFVFDIDSEYRKHTSIVVDGLQVGGFKDTQPPIANETRFIHKLVQEYLIHGGYAGTAKAFASEDLEQEEGVHGGHSPGTHVIPQKDDQDAVNRQIIRAAVLEGDIDKALKRTRAVYPKVLDEPLEAYSDLEFKLQCRKFIEMVVRIKDVKASSKRIAPGVESMDVDDGPRSAEDVAAQEHDAKCRALEKEALEYGRKLRDRYGAHEHESVRQHLEDSFALLALHNAAHLGSLGELLDKRKQRGQLAEELNSAILESQGKPSVSSLERHIAHVSECLDVAAEGGGPAAFLNVRRDFLQSRRPINESGRRLNTLSYSRPN